MERLPESGSRGPACDGIGPVWGGGGAGGRLFPIDPPEPPDEPPPDEPPDDPPDEGGLLTISGFAPPQHRRGQ